MILGLLMMIHLIGCPGCLDSETPRRTRHDSIPRVIAFQFISSFMSTTRARRPILSGMKGLMLACHNLVIFHLIFDLQILTLRGSLFGPQTNPDGMKESKTVLRLAFSCIGSSPFVHQVRVNRYTVYDARQARERGIN